MSRVDSIGIASQAGASGTYWMGTKKTTMDYFVPVESASPGPAFEEMTVDETIGSRFPTDQEVGGIHYEPEFAGKVRAPNLPRLLAPFMGDPVSTLVTAGVYNHVQDVVLAPAIPHAASILMNRTDPNPAITDLFWDCLGNELHLSCDSNDWLSFEAHYVAKSLDDTQAEPTVIQDLTKKFAFYNLCAFVSIPSIAAGVEQPVAISDFEITWNGNIATDVWALCNRGLYAVSPGNVDVEVKFTALQDHALWYRRAFMTSPEQVKLRLLAQGPIISGTDKYEIEVTVFRGIESEVEADIDAGNVLTGIPVTMKASLDAAGKFITVRTKNAVTSYP